MNFFEYAHNSQYPRDYYYRPSEDYPEYPFKKYGLSETNNDVYRMIRSLFYELGLDKEHYGQSDWNPLGTYITPGDTVLIKPNLVYHHNHKNFPDHNGLECMVTHPSVIRCVLDYIMIALKGEGKIIIGDAPVQECIFERLLDVGGYRRIEKFYSQAEGLPCEVRFVDFRHSIMKVYDEIHSQQIRKQTEFGYKVVNIGEESFFYGKESKRLRITNFDSKETIEGHTGKVQQYCISDACLQADVIVNLPKPKTHRLAGMTGALKNMIGISARKEYLPHYTMGAQEEGGDAYPYQDEAREQQYKLFDIRNQYYKEGNELKALEITKEAWALEKYKKTVNNGIDFGAWKGNDTIWRTVLDMNHAIFYTNRSGEMKERVQRKMITIGDMIVCGDNEGPLTPDYKEVGGILFADDPVEFDLFLCQLMGFEYTRVPVLYNALAKREKQQVFRSNDRRFCGEKIDKKNSFAFAPQKGWRGFIERDD
ncbi:MAG: DUF362 domain-containing protein [Lachnospiraceae bacterium]|nr:DUF362 domain-containing protein [Lachnospiraceae bacterium]GFI07886.1 hypothetical protein IMSAGC007_00330 [Lachnospiraceae bacterium]